MRVVYMLLLLTMVGCAGQTDRVRVCVPFLSQVDAEGHTEVGLFDRYLGRAVSRAECDLIEVR